MTLKTTLLAATAAVAMSAGASFAATEIFDGGTTMLPSNSNTLFTFEVDQDQGDMDFRHTFTVAAAGSGTAEVSLTTDIVGLFAGLQLEWLDASDDSVLASAPAVIGITTLSTDFTDPDTLSQTLSINWSNTLLGAPDFDGQVRIIVGEGEEPPAVPLPAGIFLLGTALGGLGIARRRKKA